MEGSAATQAGNLSNSLFGHTCVIITVQCMPNTIIHITYYRARHTLHWDQCMYMYWVTTSQIQEAVTHSAGHYWQTPLVTSEKVSLAGIFCGQIEQIEDKPAEIRRGDIKPWHPLWALTGVLWALTGGSGHMGIDGRWSLFYSCSYTLILILILILFYSVTLLQLLCQAFS